MPQDLLVILELKLEDRGLNRVQAGVESPASYLARRIPPMIPELVHTIRHVGVVRDGQGVSAALEKLAELADGIGPGDPSRGGLEARNVLFVSRAVAEAALQRTESRGAHFRRDFPERDDSGWRRHSTTNPGRGRRPPSPVGWVVSG